MIEARGGEFLSIAFSTESPYPFINIVFDFESKPLTTTTKRSILIAGTNLVSKRRNGMITGLHESLIAMTDEMVLNVLRLDAWWDSPSVADFFSVHSPSFKILYFVSFVIQVRMVDLTFKHINNIFTL